MTHAAALGFLTEPMRPAHGRARRRPAPDRLWGRRGYMSGVSGMSSCRRTRQECSGVAHLVHQRRRRHGQHRAAGVRQAVPADRLAHHPAQPRSPARPDDQQVVRLAGHLDQHRAGARRGPPASRPAGRRARRPAPRRTRPTAAPRPPRARSCAGRGRNVVVPPGRPPGGIHAVMASSGTFRCLVSSAANLSACRLPRDPCTPTMIRRTVGTATRLPNNTGRHDLEQHPGHRLPTYSTSIRARRHRS